MTADQAPSRRATRAALAAIAFLCVFFTGVFPPFSNPNELSRFETVVAAVEDGTFAIDGAIRALGGHEDRALSGGRTYSNKAPGLALAAIPVYRALRLALAAPVAGTADPIFRMLRLLTVSLLGLVALARFARRVARRNGTAAAPLVLCAVALGTPYVLYVRSFFSHAWAAALLFLAWDLIVTADERSASRRVTALIALAGLLAGWAAISEYTVAPVALLLAVRCGGGRDWRRVGVFAAGLAVPLAALGLYDTVCFGAPWILSSAREADPAYSRLASTGLFGFGPPSLRIAAAYLAHPARGLLLFSPFLLWCVPGFLRWWRSGEDRGDCALALAVTAVYFVAMTGYPNWHGGWSLGNRYLLPVLFFPAAALGYALGTPLSRGLFAAAVVFSVASHWLLTATWPYFPDDVPWPVAAGSRWFLARGWLAPSVLGELPGGGIAAFVLSAVAFGIPLALALRSAGPVSPRPALAVLLGLFPLAVLLLRPPEPTFGGRLWRAAIYGAYSGRDPAREELREVALSAATAAERRQAAGAWRLYGPPAR